MARMTHALSDTDGLETYIEYDCDMMLEQLRRDDDGNERPQPEAGDVTANVVGMRAQGARRAGAGPGGCARPNRT